MVQTFAREAWADQPAPCWASAGNLQLAQDYCFEQQLAVLSCIMADDHRDSSLIEPTAKL